MLSARERRKHTDAATRYVVGRELQRRVRELVEIRLWAAISGECDCLSIGRPGRLNVGVLVVRQLTNGAGIQVEQIEITQAAGLT